MGADPFGFCRPLAGLDIEKFENRKFIGLLLMFPATRIACS